MKGLDYGLHPPCISCYIEQRRIRKTEEAEHRCIEGEKRLEQERKEYDADNP